MGIHSGIMLSAIVVLAWMSSVEGAWRPNEAPVIDSPRQVIKKPGQTLELKCSGSFPVVWEYEADDRVEVKAEDTGGRSPVFSSTLRLDNVTFMDRKTFVCYFEEAANLIETVDLFIDDPENLLVSNRTVGMIVVNVKKGMRNEIPYCKPTHPDVSVSLSVYGSDVLELPSWSYTTEEGFVVDPAVTQTEQIYTCTAHRGDKSQELTLYLLVIVVDAGGLQRHPTINSTLARAIPVGSTFVLDCLTESDRQTFFEMKWTEPEDVVNSPRAKTDLKDLTPHSHIKKYSAKLTVVNATLEDGNRDYVCSVISKGVNYSANDTISIFAPGQEYLEVNSSHDANITANASKEEAARWVVDVFGFPRADTFHWTNSKGAELITGGKSRYSLVQHDDKNQISLVIDRVTMADSGHYQFTAENGYVSRTLDLFLTVRDSPQVSMHTNRTFYRVNRSYKFLCRATGFPYPDIRWYFKRCDPEDVDKSNCQPYERFQPTHPKMNVAYKDAPRTSVQETYFHIPGTGYILCLANNSLGSADESVLVTAIDFPESGTLGFGIHGFQGEMADKEPIETDDGIYICSASKLRFNNDIRWYYTHGNTGQEKMANKIPGMTVSEKATPWSYQKQLRIENIRPTFNGTYRCEVGSLEGLPVRMSQSINVTVRQMVPPLITATNLNQTKIKTGSTWNIGKLYCQATGVPEPQISWYKDAEPIESIPKLQDEVIFGKNFIDFKGLTSEYNGRYSCRASNRVGNATTYVDVEVLKEANWEMIISMIALAIVLICVSIVATYQYHRDQKMKRWIKKLHLKDFENGDVEKINPNEGVQNQVNLLPYDKKYEFPRERLKLGMRIGSGAFGQVVQADAMGIINGDAKTTVAVKMVKPNSDESHFKALMSELKIMIHLGQNLNVVNLLGACTKELAKKRELLVIVEYCKYGSLLSYLHRHRNDFVDQLDRNLDIVDPEVCFPIEQFMTPGGQIPSPGQSGPQGARIAANGYHTMREIQMANPELPSPEDNGYLRVGHALPTTDDYALSAHVRSVCTDMSYLSNSPTAVGTDGRKRNSSTSTWNGHYRGAYPYREVRPITTTDLLCWSFQIANGMDYLVSRNVLHGDLAARNVLLAENNVVKICDFGLARELCEEKYRKKTEVPLPIKWMALESIYYRVFSTQSDVWSFGVVMWELFTLGKNPYPGMEPDEQFYTSLSQGYRMEKPSYAPSSIYDLMLSCWDKEPSARPSFTAISDRIGDSMQEGLRNHYVDLNVPYLHLNQERMEGREDFLERMRGPDFASVSKRATPNCSYANLTIDPPIIHDYLIPRTFQHAPNTLNIPNPLSDNYQNLGRSEGKGEEPRLQVLANNAGYVYMPKHSPEPEDVFSPRPVPLSQLQDSQQFKFPSTNPLTASPSSTNPAPEFSSLTNPVMSRSPGDDNPGISNMTYVPNGCLPSNGVITPPGSNEKWASPDTKRHKNDSGVASIDSNFETNLKRTPPPPITWNGGNFIDNTEHQFQAPSHPYVQADMISA